MDMNIAITSGVQNGKCRIEVNGRHGLLDLNTGEGILRSKIKEGVTHITEFEIAQNQIERIRKAIQ